MTRTWLGPTALQILADYKRLNAVRAAGRAGDERASEPNYPGVNRRNLPRRLTAIWTRARKRFGSLRLEQVPGRVG
jgi:hypothetical protein